MIRPYLRDMINDHKSQMKVKVHLLDKVIDYETKFGEWKIQLKMRIKSISSKKFKETRTMHSISNNIEIFMGSETDDIIDELFESHLQRYQKAKQEAKKRGREFIHENVDLLYYYLHKTRLKKGKSYIKSPEWLRNKEATINPKNKKDDKCFQYALTAALNHQKIKKDPQRISKIKPFIDQYNWTNIDFLSHQKDWKKFEQNYTTITLNILFLPYNTKEIRVAYKSKHIISVKIKYFC